MQPKFVTLLLDFDRWAEIGQSLSRHKLRTALTAFGVSWGIFMLVLLMGMGKGIERGTMSLFQDVAVNSVWINGRQTSQSYRGLSPGRSIHLTDDDVAMLGKLPGVELIGSTKLIDGTSLIKHGRKTASFQLYGINSANAGIQKLVMESGRQISQLDERESRKVVVIGSRVAEVLTKNNTDILGKVITVAGSPFTVVGVYRKSLGEQSPSRVYMPLTTMRRVFDPSPKVDLIVLTISPGFDWPMIKPDVLQLLSMRHQFDTGDSSALEIYDIADEVNKLHSLMKGIRLFIMVVGVGTLLAGCIGISNTMLITVKERTREFGIRKAIGATPSNILSMVLSETLVVTLIAGAIGLFGSIATIEFVNSIGLESDYFRDPSVDLTTAYFALGILIASGLIAGYFPARYALRISPIEALRHE